MPVKTKSHPSYKRLTKKRIILFKGISIILIPLLILLLIEVSLRVLHYGNNYDLFIEYSPNHDYLTFNPDAAKKYFTDNEIATTGNREIFKKKKDNNTIRIFVLGESTTIGYPYFHNGSFHRWLQYRLTHTFPDKNFEIINLSLTAVNSYTVLGFAKQVVNYQPDAVLVYTGHNEFYGALGAGSTQTIGSNRDITNLILKMRGLRLAQLVINAYEKIKTDFGSNKPSPGGSRMQLMVASQEIPYYSTMYEKGVAQFRANTDELLSLFNERHIPLFVSNLVSNEKDLKPFVSFSPDNSKFPAFKKNITLGIKAFENKDLNAADTYLKKADQLYNFSADCNYYLGHINYLQQDFVQAQNYFIKAKDLDGLRFRAPEQFNEILIQLCKKYPNTYLVDTKAAFETSAGHHIVGNELTVDHVHPNLQGYAIMSDVFYQAIKKEHIIPVITGKEMTFEQLKGAMPVNKIDSLAGAYRILNLKRHWPYNEPHSADSVKINTEEETLAYDLTFKNIKWADIMNSLYSYYITNHQLLMARGVLENLVLEYPTDADLYEKIAMISGELKDNEKTLFYFKKSFNLSPSFDKARYLFVNYLKLDQPGEAMPYLNYAIQNNTSNFNLYPVKNFADQIIQLQNVYKKDTTDVPAILQIANVYLRMDNKDGASKYTKKALKLDKKNKVALLMQEQINNKAKNITRN
jgi:lysophospholipase L1-like esterase/Tfp pilus assembly protein PilF